MLSSMFETQTGFILLIKSVLYPAHFIAVCTAQGQDGILPGHLPGPLTRCAHVYVYGNNLRLEEGLFLSVLGEEGISEKAGDLGLETK